MYTKRSYCNVEGCLRYKQAQKDPYCPYHQRRADANVPINASRRELFGGERHQSWKGGIAEYKDHSTMKKVRKEIIAERNGICEICGGVGNEVHHKDESKSNHEKENLVLCCAKCHRATFHRKPHKSLFRSLYGMTIREIAEKFNLTYNVVYHRHKMGTLKNLLT